jgi:hypothetical protein
VGPRPRRQMGVGGIGTRSGRPTCPQACSDARLQDLASRRTGFRPARGGALLGGMFDARRAGHVRRRQSASVSCRSPSGRRGRVDGCQARSRGTCFRVRAARRAGGPRPSRAVRRGKDEPRSPGRRRNIRNPQPRSTPAGVPRPSLRFPREAETAAEELRRRDRTVRGCRPSETPAHLSRFDRREREPLGSRRREDEDENLARVGSLARGKPIFLRTETLGHSPVAASASTRPSA